MNEKIAVEVQLITDYFNSIHAILRRGTQTDIAGSGLTSQQVNLLRILAFSDGLTLKQISERMSLAHSTVSGIVDRLEKKDVVERRLDAIDKRFTRIFLGKKILDYLNHIMPSQRANLLMGAMELAKESERALIIDGLTTLQQLLILKANQIVEIDDAMK
jgi:DNA-binding MarR family transcriptional regulator